MFVTGRWTSEEPIREELFSVERLEQRAAALAETLALFLAEPGHQVDVVGNAVLVVDRQGRLQLVNRAAQEMLRDKIMAVLDTLSFREREIIKLRYGIGDGYTYTLEEVGRIFKVTRERVRQIESKTLAMLKSSGGADRLAGTADEA